MRRNQFDEAKAIERGCIQDREHTPREQRKRTKRWHGGDVRSKVNTRASGMCDGQYSCCAHSVGNGVTAVRHRQLIICPDGWFRFIYIEVHGKVREGDAQVVLHRWAIPLDHILCAHHTRVWRPIMLHNVHCAYRTPSDTFPPADVIRVIGCSDISTS